MSDSNSTAKSGSKPDLQTSKNPVQGKLNGILTETFGSSFRCPTWPATKEYIDKLDKDLELAMFKAWREGKCDERDARFFLVIPRILEIKEDLIIDVFLDAQPRHRNRSTD